MLFFSILILMFLQIVFAFVACHAYGSIVMSILSFVFLFSFIMHIYLLFCFLFVFLFFYIFSNVIGIVRDYLVSHGFDKGDRITFELDKASTQINVTDMELLEVDERKLSTHTMAWFVMWYNHKIVDANVYIGQGILRL